MEYNYIIQSEQSDRKSAQTKRIISLISSIIGIMFLFLAVRYGVTSKTVILSKESKPYAPYSSDAAGGALVCIDEVTSCVKIAKVTSLQLGNYTSNRNVDMIYLISTTDSAYPIYVPGGQAFDPETVSVVYGTAYYPNFSEMSYSADDLMFMSTLSDTCFVRVHDQQFDEIKEERTVIQWFPLLAFFFAGLVLLCIFAVCIIMSIRAEARARKRLQELLENLKTTV